MRFFIAITWLLSGAYVALWLPSPYNFISFLVTAAGGYCVLLHKTRKILLRYGFLTWTKEEICRHILITGDTGCGKTTSGFHNILFQLTQNAPDWGGLVLGVKGDEPIYINELFAHHGRKNDLIEIQVRPSDASTKWKAPHRYNLLSDRTIPWMTHAKIIVDIADSMTSGQQHAFFRPMAQFALANAFELIDAHELPVTLSRAYQLLTSREIATRYIKPFIKKTASDKQQELARFFKSTFTEAQAFEQREAVEGTIKTYLGFFLNPDVTEVFSSDQPNTFSLAEINKGAVITLGMPQALATERRYLQTYLKILFYIQALRRLDKPKVQRQHENLLLLVGDEFQDLITSSEDGISDHKIIDRIRSANTAIIAGMQSELSADPAIGERKRKVLSLNIRSRFIFRSADHDDAILSANFIGKRTIWKHTKSFTSNGSNSNSRRQEQEYYIKPEKFLRLHDHKAVIVHPSKRYFKKKIVPVDGNGKTYSWY